MSRAKNNWDFLILPDGTYPESLEQLKGAKGSKGLFGPKGDIGVKGQTGLPGTAPAAGVTAHVNFSGVTANGPLAPADIYADYGIASVEKVSTGRYIVTYDVAFTGAQDYTVLCTPGYDGTGISTGVSATVVAQTATTTEIIVERGDNGNQFDSDTVQLVAYGTGSGGAVVQKGEKGDTGGQKGEKGKEVKGEKGDKGQKGLKGLMPVGAAQAHVAFDASAGNGFNFATDVSSQFNVSNIVRNAEGDYTITWDSAFADANYTVVGSAGGRNHSGIGAANRAVNVLSRTATECQILIEAGGGSNQDADYIAICVYGTGSQGNVQTGPQGEKGEKGARVGEKGNEGKKGEVGFKGDKGIKGQVPAGAVTAHISFNGESPNGVIGGANIFSSFGISALTKNSTGDYTVTFSTPFDAANAYTVTGSAGGENFTASSRTLTPRLLDADSCNFLVERSDSGAQNDVPYVSVVFYGSGTGGAAFLKGDVGPKGVKGEIGSKGTKGEANDKGQKGHIGQKGLAGVAAAKGDVGPKGEKGEANDKGQKGEANDKGQKGGKGQKGVTGTNGTDGTDGLKGDKGPGVGQKGEKGSVGSQGPKGAKGFLGQTGFRGVKGLDGSNGDKGQKGVKGSEGRDGTAVAKGDKGDQGPSVTGPVGPKGAKGAAGTNGVDGSKGSTGQKGSDSAYDVDLILDALGVDGYGSQQQAISSGLEVGDIFFDTALTILTTVK